MNFDIRVLPPKVFLVEIIPIVFLVFTIILFVFLGIKIIKYFRELREVLKGVERSIDEINEKLDN